MVFIFDAIFRIKVFVIKVAHYFPKSILRSVVEIFNLIELLKFFRFFDFLKLSFFGWI